MKKAVSKRTVAVFLAINLICLLFFAFIFVKTSARNIKKDTLVLLEKTMISSSAETQKELERARVEEENRGRDSLEYLQWRFMLKDQVGLCGEKLKELLNRSKGGKKDKELVNVLYYNLGINYILAADFGAAIKAFEEALKYNQNDHFSYYNLGLLYSVYAKNPKKAAENYERFIGLQPQGRYSQEVKQRLSALTGKVYK
jgi:tetratricopeptide (TPR) repeat protein